MKIYVAPVDAVGGAVGTGLVDLGLGTQFLNSRFHAPQFSNMTGDGGPELNRAQEWFLDAARNAPDPATRSAHVANAVRALNNLAVWHLQVNAEPDATQLAYNALTFAEEICRREGVADNDLVRGVLLNFGNLLVECGYETEAAPFLRRARSLGSY